MKKHASQTAKMFVRTFALGHFFLIVILQSTMAQALAPLATRIAKTNLQSVVTLMALDNNDQPLGLGSGFFTSENGLVATNAHVIEGATKVIRRWQGKGGTADRIVKFSPRFDLVLLQTSFSPPPAVKLGDSEFITVGEEIVALGSPYGLEGTVSTGIISGIRSMDGIKYLQITAPISPGSSGGPIFNTNGVVVGIATSSLSSGQNLNFALPMNFLNQMPDSTLSFSAVKHVPPDSSIIQDSKDLVFANNIIDNVWSNGMLESVAFSIQNRTNRTVCALQVLFIIKNADGEILNYEQDKYPDCIAPGLARQFGGRVYTQGYRNNNKSGKLLNGSVEIRILSFTIDRKKDEALETPLKKK
jgi:S1-C subfamily serine protease